MAREIHLRFSREDLLTPSDVAQILRVRRPTALAYMRRGIVPACKIGRQWYAPKPLLDSHLDELFQDHIDPSEGH